MIFGIETEYSLGGDAVVDGEAREMLCHWLVSHIGKTRKSARAAHARGFFLENGGCVYADVGAHPEYATPECETPEELVLHAQAGDLILQQAVSDWVRQHNQPLHLYKNNVDYSGTGTTWGSHESFQVREAIDRDAIITHLVTRILYTGVGGFDNRRKTPRFVISPRACHLQHVVGSSTTEMRSIWNTRDESLSLDRKDKRVHLVCGESTPCADALYLRIATTALLLRLSELGFNIFCEHRLRDPVVALAEINRDLTLRHPVETQSGERKTALEIQERYWSLVHALRHLDGLPPWTEQVLFRWRRALDILSAAQQEGVDPALFASDGNPVWLQKRALYQRRIGRSSLQPMRVSLSRAIRYRQLTELDVRLSELPRGLLQDWWRGEPDSRAHDATTHPPSSARAQRRGSYVKTADRMSVVAWQGPLEGL